LDLLLVLRPVSDNSARYGNRRPSLKYSVGVFASSGELQTSLTIDGFAFGNVPRNMVFGPPDRSHFYFGNSWSSAMGSAAGQLVASVAKLPAVAAKGKVIPAPEKSTTMAGPTSELVEGIAVVPLVDNPKWLHGAAKIQECLENTFEKDHPGLRLISAARVREAVFPWLEAGVTPSPELLANLLGRSPIAERLKRNGVRLVLFPLIEHVDNLGGPFFCGAGAGGAGCFGVAGGEEVTKYTVPVWDVSANTMLNAPPAGETKGVSWAIGFVIPIWHMADTLGEACAEISKQFFHAIER
jgi:hypothetical protein